MARGAADWIGNQRAKLTDEDPWVSGGARRHHRQCRVLGSRREGGQVGGSQAGQGTQDDEARDGRRRPWSLEGRRGHGRPRTQGHRDGTVPPARGATCHQEPADNPQGTPGRDRSWSEDGRAEGHSRDRVRCQHDQADSSGRIAASRHGEPDRFDSRWSGKGHPDLGDRARVSSHSTVGYQLGGPNYWGGLSLPFHLHIHEYNWWNPFRWRQK